MRRYGEHPPVGTWTNRLGAYGLIPHRGRLLAVRTDDPEHGLILPGGGVDPGEAPVRALIREAREETGWTVRPVRRIAAFQRFVRGKDGSGWVRKVCQIYLCAPGVRVGPPTEPDHRPLFVPVDLAARLLSIEGERATVGRLAASLAAA